MRFLKFLDLTPLNTRKEEKNILLYVLKLGVYFLMFLTVIFFFS